MTHAAGTGNAAHPFDRALTLKPLGKQRWQGSTSADYANISAGSLQPSC